MDIPDEAVEAAVAAYLGSSYPHMYDEGEILEIRDDVREELEAAAPFLMAQAWEEGRQAERYNMEAYEETPLGMTPKRKTNPYRMESPDA